MTLNNELRKIVLVGCGHMGHAILNSWAKLPSSTEIHIIDPYIDQKKQDIQTHFKSHDSSHQLFFYNNHDLLDIQTIKPDIILFAVKPQIISSVVSLYTCKDYNETLYLSILAGKKISFFQDNISEKAQIIRLMPNLPIQYDQGVLACYPSSADVKQKHSNWLNLLFKENSKIFWLSSEEQFDVITAVSGSGPAYIFAFIEAMNKAALECGLPQDISLDIVKQTVFGSALMAHKSSESPEQLRHNVTSPQGTTQAGLDQLLTSDSQKTNLYDLLEETIKAAQNRSYELSQ